MMTLPLLGRRMVLRGGVAVAGCLAITGSQFTPAIAALGPGTVLLTKALAGWLVLAADGGARIDVFELDAASRPVRQVAYETIMPVMSVAEAARQANAAVLRAVARSWQVAAAECTGGWGRIEHRSSGRLIRFNIWTDFS